MGASLQKASIFSHKLDRVAFTAYFLGAVVPLLALFGIVERYILPTLADTHLVVGLIGVVVSIAVLSLSSFLILRRSTRESLRQMDRDNLQLQSLLDASRALAHAQYGGDAAAIAVRAARELTGASAAFVIGRGEPEKSPVLLESAGENPALLYEKLRDPLHEMAELVMSGGRPALRGSQGAQDGMSAAAAVPLAGDPAPIGALAAIHSEPGRSFDAVQVNSLSTLASLASVALRNAELRDSQRNFFTHVTDILVSALDAHLDYHSGHGNRVAQLANRIGRELGFDDPRMQRLHFGALLHDIGMLKIDRSVQKNPRTCEKHTVLGSRMLGRILFWRDLAPIVQHHHERFDGTGYPEGLAGEDIPLEARIIAVCDAYDSMTSDTSYKVALSAEEAVQELLEGAGTQFDPEVARTFQRLVERGTIR